MVVQEPGVSEQKDAIRIRTALQVGQVRLHIVGSHSFQEMNVIVAVEPGHLRRIHQWRSLESSASPPHKRSRWIPSRKAQRKNVVYICSKRTNTSKCR